MKPDSVKSIYISGKKLDNLLFQCALHWAEKGQTVWFITPTKINNLPTLWENPPSKEVLKLIIIMYITNRKDLLTKFNEIHLWQKLPKVVIIMELEQYLFINDQYDYDVASFLLASILDGMSTCSLKINSPTYLMISCNLTLERNVVMKNIIDLLFSYYFSALKDNSGTHEKLIEIFNK